MAGILGDDFAIRTPNLVTRRVKWDDITHGLAILAVEQYTSHWSRPLSYEHTRAIGWRFEELEDRIRNLLTAYSARAETPDQVVEALVAMIKDRRDSGIDEILSVFLTADTPSDEFRAVPPGSVNGPPDRFGGQQRPQVSPLFSMGVGKRLEWRGSVRLVQPENQK